jgi:DNA-binding XRE family transcriptional regulator
MNTTIAIPANVIDEVLDPRTTAIQIRCSACGAETPQRVRVAAYQDKILGYPVVLYDGVEHITCLSCGHSSHFIPDVPGLMASVAVMRLMMPQKFNGREIQAIRKSAGVKQVDLAKMLDVTPETLSRWENGKEPLRMEAEKFFRLHVLKLLGTRTYVPETTFKE